jgi:hypothetical protein
VDSDNDLERECRNIKRRIRPMLGFKSFWTVRIVLGGIVVVNMLRKDQLTPASFGETPLSAATRSTNSPRSLGDRGRNTAHNHSLRQRNRSTQPIEKASR